MTKGNKFLYTEEGKQYLIDNYQNGSMSASDVTRELDLGYNNLVYRALRKHGIARKDRSQAQSNFLTNNPDKHPTKGKERTLAEKKKIGGAMHEFWNDIPDDEKERRREKSRESWLSQPETDRKAWLKKSHVKLKEASITGSKFEKFILAALITSKFKVQPHKKFLFEDSEMSIDIFLPVEGICIEIDGPSHFLPIFGEEALKKTIGRDLEKNQQLLANGYSIIRILNEKGYHSKTVMDIVSNKLIKLIKDVAERPKAGLVELLVEEL